MRRLFHVVAAAILASGVGLALLGAALVVFLVLVLLLWNCTPPLGDDSWVSDIRGTRLGALHASRAVCTDKDLTTRLRSLLCAGKVKEFNELKRELGTAYLDFGDSPKQRGEPLHLQLLDLRGIDLSRSLLPSADFAFADLRGSDFRGTYLAEASFAPGWQKWNVVSFSAVRTGLLGGADFRGAILVDELPAHDEMYTVRANFSLVDRTGALFDSDVPPEGFVGCEAVEAFARGELEAYIRTHRGGRPGDTYKLDPMLLPDRLWTDQLVVSTSSVTLPDRIWAPRILARKVFLQVMARAHRHPPTREVGATRMCEVGVDAHARAIRLSISLMSEEQIRDGYLLPHGPVISAADLAEPRPLAELLDAGTLAAVVAGHPEAASAQGVKPEGTFCGAGSVDIYNADSSRVLVLGAELACHGCVYSEGPVIELPGPHRPFVRAVFSRSWVFAGAGEGSHPILRGR